MLAHHLNYKGYSIQPNDVQQTCILKDYPKDILTVIFQAIFLNIENQTIFSISEFSNLAKVCRFFYYRSYEIFEFHLPSLGCKEEYVAKVCRAGNAALLQNWLANPQLLLPQNLLEKVAVMKEWMAQGIKYRIIHGHVIKVLLECKRFDPSVANSVALKWVIKWVSEGDGKLKIIKELFQDPRVNLSAHKNLAIRWASGNGYTELVKFLLQNQKVNPADYNNVAIYNAAFRGHKEVVEMLLQDLRVDPSRAVDPASQGGHIEIVRMLLEDSRLNLSSEISCFVMTCVAKNGAIEILKLLVASGKVDPASYREAFREASENGHVEIVRELLKDTRVDPAAFDNYAIKMASKNGHAEVVKILVQDGRASLKIALTRAWTYDRTEIIKLLLKEGIAKPATRLIAKLAILVIPIIFSNKLLRNNPSK